KSHIKEQSHTAISHTGSCLSIISQSFRPLYFKYVKLYNTAVCVFFGFCYTYIYNNERIDCLRLRGKKVIGLVDKDFEELEHWYAAGRLRGAGAQVMLVGPEAGATYYGKYAVPANTDFAFSDIDPTNYDAILVPVGWAPDTLRRYEEVLTMVKHMGEAKK